MARAEQGKPKAKRARVPLERIPRLLERAVAVVSAEVERLSLRATGTPAQAKSEAARPRLSEPQSKALARYINTLTATYRGHRDEEREIRELLKGESLAELQQRIKADGKAAPAGEPKEGGGA